MAFNEKSLVKSKTTCSEDSAFVEPLSLTSNGAPGSELEVEQSVHLDDHSAQFNSVPDSVESRSEAATNTIPKQPVTEQTVGQASEVVYASGNHGARPLHDQFKKKLVQAQQEIQSWKTLFYLRDVTLNEIQERTAKDEVEYKNNTGKLEKIITNLQEKTTRMEKQLKKLREDAEDTKQVVAQSQGLAVENKELTKQVNTLTAEKEVLVAEKKGLVTDKASLTEQVSKKEKDLAELRKLIETERLKFSEYRAKTEEEVGQLKDTIAKLKSQITIAERKQEEAKSNQEASDKELAELKHKLQCIINSIPSTIEKD